MAPPKQMDIALQSLPLRMGICVPDDLLEDWFSPGMGMPPPSPEALAAAGTYGKRFACEFEHDFEPEEGVFWKWMPAV